MPRIIVVGALVAAALAVTAPAANAEFYMSKAQAESFASSDITTRYMYLGVIDHTDSETCRPSRLARLNPHRGKRYHRWVCTWSAEADILKVCTGVVMVAGSDEDINNTYYRSTVKGADCTVKEPG